MRCTAYGLREASRAISSTTCSLILRQSYGGNIGRTNVFQVAFKSLLRIFDEERGVVGIGFAIASMALSSETRTESMMRLLSICFMGVVGSAVSSSCDLTLYISSCFIMEIWFMDSSSVEMLSYGAKLRVPSFSKRSCIRLI